MENVCNVVQLQIQSKRLKQFFFKQTKVTLDNFEQKYFIDQWAMYN